MAAAVPAMVATVRAAANRCEPIDQTVAISLLAVFFVAP
jgi:hypothetical protein